MSNANRREKKTRSQLIFESMMYDWLKKANWLFNIEGYSHEHLQNGREILAWYLSQLDCEQFIETHEVSGFDLEDPQFHFEGIKGYRELSEDTLLDLLFSFVVEAFTDVEDQRKSIDEMFDSLGDLLREGAKSRESIEFIDLQYRSFKGDTVFDNPESYDETEDL